MPRSKLPTVWKAEPHTIAKVEILREYLIRWFQIMGMAKPGRDILYIDGFAGPGHYTNYDQGSPIAALRAAAIAYNSRVAGKDSGKRVAGDIYCAFNDGTRRQTMIEQLADPFAAVVREVCVWYRGQPVPGRQWDRVIREGGGHTRFQPELRPDFERLTAQVSAQLNALPAFDALEQRVSADPTLATRLLSGPGGAPLADEAARRQRLWSAVVGPFLARYFDRDTDQGRLYTTRGLRFDATSFDATLRQADADLQAARGTTTLTMITPSRPPAPRRRHRYPRRRSGHHAQARDARGDRAVVQLRVLRVLQTRPFLDGDVRAARAHVRD